MSLFVCVWDLRDILEYDLQYTLKCTPNIPKNMFSGTVCLYSSPQRMTVLKNISLSIPNSVSRYTWDSFGILKRTLESIPHNKFPNTQQRKLFIISQRLLRDKPLLLSLLSIQCLISYEVVSLQQYSRVCPFIYLHVIPLVMPKNISSIKW